MMAEKVKAEGKGWSSFLIFMGAWQGPATCSRATSENREGLGVRFYGVRLTWEQFWREMYFGGSCIIAYVTSGQ